VDFRGHRIVKASFWSQGPVLLQTLAILDHFDDADLDPSTERGAHIILEAVKLAMADRDSYYGDRDVAAAGLHELLSPEYAESRAALITDTASEQFRPGAIAGCKAHPPPLLRSDGNAPGSAPGVGEPTVSKQGAVSGDTVHLDIVDRWGNMVSATPSGGWLQSNPTIAELGFCLGSRLQMTWLDPDSPSGLAPGRRPRTTLAPTILLRDGVAVSALGSPGGDQQDQWQLLYLLRTIVGGYTLQEAIDAPMFHTTALVESFWPRNWTPLGAVVEDRLGAGVITGLRRRGHHITVAGPWSLGRMSAVGRDPDTGVLSAAANPRGCQGYAAGR
jgi:gamma-glutamyltranspeptidase / glutathione hydrolase